MGNKKNQKAGEQGFAFVELSLIDKSSFNPRKVFDENSLNELSQSIKEKGVIQPIVLRPVGKRYEVVCGERRYRAAILAELDTIPACIKDLSDDEAEEFAITENLQRKDVSPIEESESFNKLVLTGRYDVNSLSKKFGKSEAFVRGRLKLVNLITDFRDLLEEEAINIGVATVVACYSDDLQRRLFDAHFADNCQPYASWKTYKPNRLQAAIEQHYSTDLEEYLFDKEECLDCPFNSATFSLFTTDESCATCTKMECLREKNAMYVYQQVVELQIVNPKLGVCRANHFVTNAEAVLKLEDKGVEVEDADIISKYIAEEPELPCREDFDDEEMFQEAMNKYDDKHRGYEQMIAAKNDRLSRGEIRECIQIQAKGARIVCVEAKEPCSGQENTKTGALTDEKNTESPEIYKLEGRITRNKEICQEKITEKQKDLVKSMDIPSSELNNLEVTLMYLYMIRKMRDKSYDKLGFEKNRWYINHTDLLELTEEQKNIIIRDFAITNLELYSGYRTDAPEDNPLRTFLNLHASAEVTAIDEELIATYKKRNDRLQERIDAMITDASEEENEVEAETEEINEENY